MPSPSLSTVIVATNELDELRDTLPALVAELSEDDEVLIVDNASSDGLAEELEHIAPGARRIEMPENVGFAAGVNRGAEQARGEVVVVLNPDAVVQPGWARAIRDAAGGPWAGWMALVTLDGGTTINASKGVLHFTGFGWAGQMGEQVSVAPTVPTEVGFLSGACLAVPRSLWNELGGFPEHFFLYCEDVDLSLRMRLRGGRLAVVPNARVAHGYEFLKNTRKWRLLERNRWAMMLRTYPGPLLALIFPALLATEVAVWAIAVRGGWVRMKALATLDVIRWLPRLLRERRAIQASRTADTATFASALTHELSSPYFGSVGHSTLVRVALRAYWYLVRSLLQRFASAIS